MNDILLPRGTRVWPVLSKPDNPTKFPSKFQSLDKDILLSPDVIYRVPKSPRFKFFQDGPVDISYLTARNGGPIVNEDGKYAYCQFSEPKDDATGNIAHGFIFNMIKVRNKQPEEWNLEPYFVERQREEEQEDEKAEAKKNYAANWTKVWGDTAVDIDPGF